MFYWSWLGQEGKTKQEEIKNKESKKTKKKVQKFIVQILDVKCINSYVPYVHKSILLPVCMLYDVLWYAVGLFTLIMFNSYFFKELQV